MKTIDLLNLTIEKTQQNLRNREYTAQELTLAYLDKIKETDSEIQAYLNLTEELALKQAIRADKMLSHGEAQPLTGIPCAIKDNILVAGEKCTAGSKFLENYIAPYDATVIEKLKNQGAVILGKTNLDRICNGFIL